MEDRWYSRWRDRVPWHTETRKLLGRAGGAAHAHGTVELWVDLFDRSKGAVPRAVGVAPPPPEEYELRAVAWNASGVAAADKSVFGEYMTDMYTKCYLRGRDPGSRCGEQDTDTHYRSMDGEGKFNWRMKWQLTYLRHTKRIIMREDGARARLRSLLFDESLRGVPPVLCVELWDNDLLPFSDDYLGRAELPLTALPSRVAGGEAGLQGSDAAAKRLKGLAGKLALAAGGGAPIDVFALDPATSRPRYLMQETPKLWFGVYRDAGAGDFRNYDTEEDAEGAEEGRKAKVKRDAIVLRDPLHPSAGTEQHPKQPPSPSAPLAEAKLTHPLLAGDDPGQVAPSAVVEAPPPPPPPGGRLVGLVQLSFSLCAVEQKDSKAAAAGAGRAEPNQHPKLAEPERPDSSFSPLLNPCRSLYYIIWKNLGRYIICVFFIALGLFALYVAFGCAIKKMLGSVDC